MYVCPALSGCTRRYPWLADRTLQRRDIGQVAVALGEVQAVADGKAIGDLEAHEADRQLHLAAVGLGQQGADVERMRYCRVSPESTMSSTMRTWRPSIGVSRSLRIRTTPLESVAEP